jgi:hypothetical protein
MPSTQPRRKQTRRSSLKISQCKQLGDHKPRVSQRQRRKGGTWGTPSSSVSEKNGVDDFRSIICQTDPEDYCINAPKELKKWRNKLGIFDNMLTDYAPLEIGTTRLTIRDIYSRDIYGRENSFDVEENDKIDLQQMSTSKTEVNPNETVIVQGVEHGKRDAVITITPTTKQYVEPGYILRIRKQGDTANPQHITDIADEPDKTDSRLISFFNTDKTGKTVTNYNIRDGSNDAEQTCDIHIPKVSKAWNHMCERVIPTKAVPSQEDGEMRAERAERALASQRTNAIRKVGLLVKQANTIIEEQLPNIIKSIEDKSTLSAAKLSLEQIRSRVIPDCLKQMEPGK